MPRGMVVEQPHPQAGNVKTVRNPVLFSETTLEYEQGPPVLGEHTEEVLREVLGRKEQQLQELKKSGVI